MVPQDIDARCREFGDSLTDELGISVLWDHCMETLASQSDPLGNLSVPEDARERLGSLLAEQYVSGHPRINARLIVGFWTVLEAFVEDLFVLRLQHHPEFLGDERLANVRVKLAEFQTLTEDERLRKLHHSLEVAATNRSAFGKFEHALGIVELSGEVDDAVRRTLLELEQARNVIVHRNGVVDARLIDANYRLEVEAGDDLVVSPSDFNRYYSAVNAYGRTIVNRIAVAYQVRDPARPVGFLDDTQQSPQPPSPL